MKYIFFCKNCSDTYSGTNEGAQLCPVCKQRLILTDFVYDAWVGLTDEQKQEKRNEWKKTYADKEKYIAAINETAKSSDAGESGIGHAIKTVSGILLFLCILGSIIIAVTLKDLWAYGIAAGLVSTLLCLVCYGIGEICCRLKSIDSKLK